MKLEYIGTGKSKRYTIASKILVSEALTKGESIGKLSKETTVAICTLRKWKSDYLNGTYTLNNAAAVARLPKQQRTIDEVMKNIEKLKMEAREIIEQEYKNALARLAL